MTSGCRFGGIGRRFRDLGLDLARTCDRPLRAARARAREIAWAQHADTRTKFPQVTVAGQQVGGLVLDIDATIVICHCEKESATRAWKKTFGYHPLLCFLDNTGVSAHLVVPRRRAR